MNNEENIKSDSIKNIARYAQVLLSDGMLLQSDDKNISSPERKNLTKLYIKLIRNNLDIFEKEALT